jgi:hypothetical protein
VDWTVLLFAPAAAVVTSVLCSASRRSGAARTAPINVLSASVRVCERARAGFHGRSSSRIALVFTLRGQRRADRPPAQPRACGRDSMPIMC